MISVNDGYDGGQQAGAIFSRNTTGLTGGTYGNVNTTLCSYTVTGKDVQAFEWGALNKLDNYSVSGQNCAHYAQGNKFGIGPTWARTAETCSTEPLAGAQITDEVDVWVSGPNTGDKGCSDLTVGDGRFIRGLGRSDVAEAHFAQRTAACSVTPWARFAYGYIVNSFRWVGILLESDADSAIQLKGNYVVGINLQEANCQSAIRLHKNQRITFDETDYISMSFTGTRFAFKAGPTEVFSIDMNTGDIYKKGVKVL